MNQNIKYGHKEGQEIAFDTKNLSIVGSNGAGKSSLMRSMKIYNSNFILISAHKNLLINQSEYRGQENQWLKTHKDHFAGPGNNAGIPITNNSLQTDFNQMLELAFRDYQDISTVAINEGQTLEEINRKLDGVFSVWHSIFKEKQLIYDNKKIRVKEVKKENYYEIDNLSDGERVVLYILLKITLSENTDVIVIDEPETFLNPAILNELFDECEKLKSDTTFVYFSHDLEFVTTRRNNTIFWIKEYIFPSQWKLEKINAGDVPEELIVKIIGSNKQKILFVESEQNKDAQLYQLIYPDFKIWPVGGCGNVINYTKTFNTNTEKFDKTYFGLIDRDLRPEKQVEALKQNSIYCLPVAIYENIFFNKEIIKFVFDHLGIPDFNDSFLKLEEAVKSKVLEDNFKFGYKKFKIQQLFNQEIDSIVKGEKAFSPDFSVYDTELETLKEVSYQDVLKIFNQKNLKDCSSILGELNWAKWERQVLNIFNTEKAAEFRKEFLKFMPDIK